MKAILSCCVTLLLSLGAASAQAGGRFHPPGGTLEPFVLLDNFSGDHIDKTIWNGTRRGLRILSKELTPPCAGFLF